MKIKKGQWGVNGTVTNSIIISRALKSSCLAFAVFLLSFVFVPYIISDANATSTQVSTNVDWVPISLTLTSNGDVSFGSIVPSSASGSNYGSMKVVRKNISVETNGKAADVYLSTDSATTSLAYDSGNGISATSMEIPGIEKSANTPAEFDDTASFTGVAWGYAVPVVKSGGNNVSNIVGDFSDEDDYIAAFGNDSSVSQVYDQIVYGETGYNFGEWAAVPDIDDPQKVWSVTTTNSNGFGGSGDTDKNNFDIYYAVMVDNNLVSGSYSNQVVYTAIANSASLDEASTNIRVSNTTSNGITSGTKRYTTVGDILDLEFDLTQSQAGLLEDGIAVYLVPHQDVSITGSGSSAVYSVSSTMESNIDSYPTCKINSISIDSTEGSGASVNCTVQEKNSAGSNAAISYVSTTASGELSDGYYDIWVRNATYGIDYISGYWTGSNSAATLAFVGLQSKDSSSNYIVDQMQEMTASVCKNTNIWGTTYGTAARVYDPTGTTKLADGDNNATTVAANTAIGVGTFRLTDSRDSKTYLVRRLADGNCWMVQNLSLDLNSVVSGTVTLNRTNTDLNDSSKYTSDATKYVPTTYTMNSNASGGIQQKLGTTQTCANQFQSVSLSGTQSGAGCHWGSHLTEYVALSGTSYVFDGTNALHSALDGTDIVAADGSNYRPNNRSYLPDGSRNNTANPTSGNTTTDYSNKTWIENNSLAEIPRSYDNGTGWVDNSTPNADGAGSLFKSNGTAMEGASLASGSISSSVLTATGDNAETQYVGTWYNWYAASAESGTFAMKTDSVAGSATDSICPRGWHLPHNKAGNADSADAAAYSGYNSGDKIDSWYNLLTATYQANNTSTVSSINSTAGSRMIRNVPMSLVFSGNYRWYTGGLYNRGTHGNYWSATPYAYTYSRSLYFYSANVNPQNGNNKTSGFTVRCVAE